MNSLRLPMGQVPKWARIGLVAVPLVLALNAFAVEVQFGEANKEIPGGSQHDEAWKTYHRIRWFNRATIGIASTAAAVFAVGFLAARGDSEANST